MSTILSSLSVLPFSEVHVDSLPIEVQRADALYDFLHMPTLDGVSGTLGFPLERRVSLMLVTMLISAVGVGHSPSPFDEKYSPAST